MTTTHSASVTLSHAMEKLSIATQLPEIMRIVAETARSLTDSDGSTFVLLDNDKCYYADEQAIAPLWKGQRFPASACISGWSMLRGEVVVIEDIYRDDRIPHDAYRPTFVKSLCMVPIRPESPLGAIGNYWSKEVVLPPNKIQLLRILANSTAIALENLNLKTSLSQSSERTQKLETALVSMAHDLRTPLGGIIGLTDLLKMEEAGNLNPKTQAYINLILDTGKRMSSQIEKMLALYRVTNGALSKQPINLSIMAQKIYQEIEFQFPKSAIKMEIQPNLVTFADPSLIHVVLENLLSNAVKYSSKKPEIKIRVGREEKLQEYPTFFVQDNGDGFEPSQAHRLFTPMTRLHSAEDFEGTGMGLASVARIIELHGGRVRAEGKKMEGATFYFSLPSA